MAVTPNAVVVERYQELDSFTQAFGAGHLRFLMVVGPAGTGKSRAMRAAVAGQAAWVDGNATAFGVYCAAFKHQDQPIVLDDVDALYRDANGIRLLKQLCQSEPSRWLGWYSGPQYLERRGVPPKFTTSSPVAIIANRWSTSNADVAALEDRGHVIVFDPPPIEIHRQAAIWFHDQEVFDFVSEHLHLIANHSFRTYLLALELKKARMDWKRTIFSRFLSGPLLLVARLKADPAFKSKAERVEAFREAGGGSRATYFNYAKNLSPPRERCKISLQTSPARTLCYGPSSAGDVLGGSNSAISPTGPESEPAASTGTPSSHGRSNASKHASGPGDTC